MDKSKFKVSRLGILRPFRAVVKGWRLPSTLTISWEAPRTDCARSCKQGEVHPMLLGSARRFKQGTASRCKNRDRLWTARFIQPFKMIVAINNRASTPMSKQALVNFYSVLSPLWLFRKCTRLFPARPVRRASAPFLIRQFTKRDYRDLKATTLWFRPL